MIEAIGGGVLGTLLASASRLNRRIQCQQVGLFGNLVDHLEH